MDNSHRRILRIVQQSATSTTCELPASGSLCGAGGCTSCSVLTNSGVLTSGDGAARNRAAESSIKIELPASIFPAFGRQGNARANLKADSATSGDAASGGDFARRGDFVKVGDYVEIKAPAGMLLALSSVFYLAPAILMLFFAVSCSFLYPDSEALVAVSAAIGLGVGLGAIIFFGPALRSIVTKQLVVRSNNWTAPR